MAIRDRFDAPDTSVPFRPNYFAPASNKAFSQAWYDPRGVGMYWRGKWNNGTTSTEFPDWDDAANIVRGRLSPIGGGVTNGRTMTVRFELAGRVRFHEWIYTVRKVFPGGTVTETQHSLLIDSGATEYGYSFTAPAGGSAIINTSGNKFQYNVGLG